METAYHFTVDLWQFYKRHADTDNSDESWKRIVAEAQMLDATYGSNKHMHEIILDVLEALEEEANGKDQSNS